MRRAAAVALACAALQAQAGAPAGLELIASVPWTIDGVTMTINTTVPARTVVQCDQQTPDASLPGFTDPEAYPFWNGCAYVTPGSVSDGWNLTFIDDWSTDPPGRAYVASAVRRFYGLPAAEPPASAASGAALTEATFEGWAKVGSLFGAVFVWALGMAHGRAGT